MPYPWSAGNVLTATDLNSALAAKTDTAMTQNAQTGTSYSYALADASKLLTMSNAASNTVTVTKQATVTWVTGTQLRVMNLGAGVTTLVADTGVTINGNVALKQYQGGTLIRTASDVWLFVPTASSGGMDLMAPTSVAGTGVTLSGGQVNFSAATSVSANGVFSSVYDSYRIHFYCTAGSINITWRLRLAGTDNTAASSEYQISNGAATTITSARSTAQTSNWLTECRGVNAYAVMDLTNPALAASTIYTIQSSASSLINQYSTAGVHAVSTAFDGITVIGSAAMTGTLRIYGLRNA